jgi:hypothetical protein
VPHHHLQVLGVFALAERDEPVGQVEDGDCVDRGLLLEEARATNSIHTMLRLNMVIDIKQKTLRMIKLALHIKQTLRMTKPSLHILSDRYQA